jgi:glycosyltransferase involved in cell wall biosynthesis
VKRVLLVTYHYPPLTGSGVYRPLRLSKYLPRVGWDVTVLTVSQRARLPKDPALLREVPSQVRVERTPSLEPRVPLLLLRRIGLRRLVERVQPWFMVPDDQLGWTPFARARGRRLLARTPHQAIVSTAGPYSAHLVGLGLSRSSGLPWVADFRDEWTTNPYLSGRYPSAWHRRLNRRLERRVLEAADRVTCVSEPWLAALARAAPDCPSTKFACLPNGYDAEHFPRREDRAADRFRIVYTGAFYGHRCPAPFLEALRRVVESGWIPEANCEVVFMGGGVDAARVGQRFGQAVARMLRVVAQRPHFEALELLQRAALLLLVVPPEGGTGNHTGKLFPYLAAGRPILALAPPGNVAAELVLRSRSGIVADPDDPAAIQAGLRSAHEAWKRGVALDQDRALIERYEARAQAETWARLLDEISA